MSRKFIETDRLGGGPELQINVEFIRMVEKLPNEKARITFSNGDTFETEELFTDFVDRATYKQRR